MSDHGGNNVVHVAGEELKRIQEMMTVANDAREQFFISFGADAVEGQGAWSPHDILWRQNGA